MEFSISGFKNDKSAKVPTVRGLSDGKVLICINTLVKGGYLSASFPFPQDCGTLELFIHRPDLRKTGVRPLSDKYCHSVTLFHAGDKFGGA